MALLSIRNLNTVFSSENGEIKACNQIDLDINQGKTMGLIGETGCGKSVLGMSILNLLPYNAKITGQIFYKDQDVLTLSNKGLREIRGREIGLLPQSPATSLNPVLKIGEQISEGLRFHRKMKKKEAVEKSIEMLKILGVQNPKKGSNKFPHQLSGGMKQRVLAAISITGEPSLLIADEPTKGLDAIVKAQVVEVLCTLKRETGASLLLITHDLKVAACLCDEIAVMYSGEIVEKAKTDQILNGSVHPYTQGLLKSLPERGLNPIPGQSPSLRQKQMGCRFYDRCFLKKEQCRKQIIPLRKINGSLVRCINVN